MIAFFMGPLGKYAAIGLVVAALLAAGGIYLSSAERNAVNADRAAEAVAADHRTIATMKNAADATAAAASEADPRAALQREFGADNAAKN